jgi:hypothetical protein
VKGGCLELKELEERKKVWGKDLNRVFEREKR